LHTIPAVENVLKRFVYVFKQKLGSTYFKLADEFNTIEEIVNIEEYNV